jgi:WhiB family transcriptional regulator, redox-sensing transcriptional regulator
MRTEDSWRTQAACLDADPEIFFPPDGSNGREAIKVCATCPVSEQCLDYAIENSLEFGFWGGLSPNARHKYKRQILKVVR